MLRAKSWPVLGGVDPQDDEGVFVAMAIGIQSYAGDRVTISIRRRGEPTF
jgi:hypothetical protein